MCELSDNPAPQPPLYNFSQGKMIIVTTSGDRIFANYSGQFMPTGGEEMSNGSGTAELNGTINWLGW